MTQGHDTNRQRQEDGTYLVDCVHCGNVFEAKRYDASFCNATCRVGYQRAQAQLKSDIAMIPGRARQIRQLAEKHPKAEGMFEALMKAQAEIQKAIAACEYEEIQLGLPIQGATSEFGNSQEREFFDTTKQKLIHLENAVKTNTSRKPNKKLAKLTKE